MVTLLHTLAQRYETADFLAADPSQFMHRYSDAQQQERVAFIAAALSYGSRKQFLPKIDELLANGLDCDRPDTDTFYRLHTVGMVRRFLAVLDSIYTTYGSMLAMMHAHDIHTAMDALRLITAYFAERNASDLVPKDTKSTCKRLCMFLRWMVRDSSPVDLGLWAGQIDKRTLIMPLDTHVLQEAQRLGLLASRTTTMATAQRLTDRMREIFPDDPLRADFALFGLGVSEEDKSDNSENSESSEISEISEPSKQPTKNTHYYDSKKR